MQSHLLADIGKAVISAGLIGIPAYFLRIPLILAYILAGILIGPQVSRLINDMETISNISEIGLVLLMFILGLEINLKKLLETGKTVLLTGFVQIVGSILISVLLLYFIFDEKNAFQIIYVASIVALSSTLIVVKILSDQMDLDSLPSRITLGILVMQDLFAVAFLAIQPNLGNIKLAEISQSILQVFFLVGFSGIMAKLILPTIFKAVSKHSELLLILAIAWCFCMCGVANYLSLSSEMGALIAGISIASFPYHVDVAAKISSLRDFFITLFFVSLGMQIPVPNKEIIELALLISMLVYVTRVLTIFPILHNKGFANRVSLIATINLAQLSEFSLVLATLGIKLGHINYQLYYSFIFSLIFTSFISSFLIPKAHDFYKLINPLLISIGIRDSLLINKNEVATQEKNYNVIMLGFYRDSSSLLYEMQKQFSESFLEQLLIVDFNPEAHYELKKRNINCRFGDISNLENLKSLNLENSKLIICSIPDKVLKGTTNLKLLLLLKKLAPNTKIILTAENIELAKTLYEHGASYVYLPRVIGAQTLLEVIEQFHIKNEDEINLFNYDSIKNRKEIIS